ncbi:MAG: SpoIIE family protein phosphatase [Oscillospiraceae bacterium]|nr:SpoIIE family protein phosphatase [Oscillospiraceae bacterium]
MKLKEKTRPKTAERNDHKRDIPAFAKILLSALFGFLAAGTPLGNGAPLCTAIAAISPLFGGTAAFAGAIANVFIAEKFSSYITEIISMPAVIFARASVTMIFGRNLSPKGTSALAGFGYISCGIIAAFFGEMSPALIIAIAFRGIICAAAAYFASRALSFIQNGTGITAETALSYAVTYALSICMLCGISFGTINAGRVAGLLITAVFAYRYGISGGGTAGALSAFSFGTVSSIMSSTSAITVCSGLAAGLAAKKGKLFSAAVFVSTALACSLVYGMPSDTLKLIPDMTIAAAIFCIVPESFLRKPFSAGLQAPSSAVKQYGNRLRFAASAVSDVKTSFAKAADVFDRRERENDIATEVCGKVCSLCRSSTFCGENEKHRINTYLLPAEEILKKKGYITENELHKGLERCSQKNMIAETFNELHRLDLLEKRSGNITGCMREITLEQLSGTEDMLNYFSKGSEQFPCCDERLSEYVREALADYGVNAPSASVFSDKEGRIYIECFYEGLLNAKLDTVAESFGKICDREFSRPEVISFNRTTRLCFCEQTVYEAETGRAAVNGREATSGDSDVFFRDGFGNIYLLISDGMGSGVRAAVESCMAVSLMMRIIRAGLGINAAVRLINLLLLTKSADESFATVDLMKLNLFSGKAEIIKLGAAQTFIKSNGTVKTVESWSTPVGIVSSVEISRRNIQLSDGDEIVMITDGINEDCFPKVRELMLSIGVTAQDCAERIIGFAENYNSGDCSHKDDKTVCVVKLHKI